MSQKEQNSEFVIQIQDEKDDCLKDCIGNTNTCSKEKNSSKEYSSRDSSEESSCCEKKSNSCSNELEESSCRSKGKSKKCAKRRQDTLIEIIALCCEICRQSLGLECCKTDCCIETCCMLKKKEEQEPLLFHQNKKNNPNGETNKTIELAVSGLTCSDCTTTLQNHLLKVLGISVANVSELTHKAKITFDTDIITEEKIVQEFKRLNYSASILSPNSQVLVKFTTKELLDEETTLSVMETLKRKPGIESIKYENFTFTICYQPPLIGARDIMSFLEKKSKTDISLVVEEQQSQALISSTREARNLRKRFFLSLLFSAPVFLIAFVLPPIHPSITLFFGTKIVNAFTIKMLIEWILTSPVQLYLSLPLYLSAYKALRYTKKANMDTLVVISTTTAYVYSVISALLAIANSSYEGESFFETSGILLSLILLGRFLEMQAKKQTSQTLTKLLALQPQKATLLFFENSNNNNSVEEKEIELCLVQRKDILKVIPGAKIPTDGIVLNGASSVDESMLTGESLPVTKTKDSLVYGGTINKDGTLQIQVTKIAAEGTISSMVKLVEEAQSSKAPIQDLSDKIASYFVPFVLGLSVVVFFIWLGLSLSGRVTDTKNFPPLAPLPFSLQFFLSLLVIACPCALGLAAPTPLMVSIGRAANFGILFKGGGVVLQQLSKAEVIVFDKTGTLTEGKLQLVSYKNALLKKRKFEDSEFFFLIGSAETSSEHPIAKSIVQFSISKISKKLVQPSEFTAFPGKGMKAIVSDCPVFIGNKQWMEENAIQVPLKIEKKISKAELKGETSVFVGFDKEFGGYITIADTPRKEAQAVVTELEKMGIQVWMISGDNQRTASAIGSQIGISSSRVFGNVLPAEKSNRVQEIQQRDLVKKKIVVMVGDGINDSPALTQADVGIAIGSGTEIAIEAAGVVLMKNSLFSILDAIALARATFNCIRLNFAWSFIYNIFAIALAAGVFYPVQQFVLPPAFAGISEVLSSLPIIFFSLGLYLFKPKVNFVA